MLPWSKIVEIRIGMTRYQIFKLLTGTLTPELYTMVSDTNGTMVNIVDPKHQKNVN